MDGMGKFRKFLRELLPHAVWRLVEFILDRAITFLAGAGVIAFGIAFAAWLRHNLDFVVIVSGFLLSLSLCSFIADENQQYQWSQRKCPPNSYPFPFNNRICQ